MRSVCSPISAEIGTWMRVRDMDAGAGWMRGRGEGWGLGRGGVLPAGRRASGVEAPGEACDPLCLEVESARS